MKRVHVPEIEDQAWLPAWLRLCMTRLIVVFNRVMGVPGVLAALVARALDEARVDEVIDLGSGAGGSMPEVIARLRADAATADIRLTLTDLHPSPDAVRQFDGREAPGVRYLAEPVDAALLAAAPEGLKTMVNCFHHMRPAKARALLESALASRQPLLVYEVGDDRVPFAVWCLCLPIGWLLVALSAFALTPLVRPLGWRQLFFTYVVPIVPILYGWDGQASMARIYGLADLDELLQGLDSPDYRWEKGIARTAEGRGRGLYLLGLPVRAPAPPIA